MHKVNIMHLPTQRRAAGPWGRGAGHWRVFLYVRMYACVCVCVKERGKHNTINPSSKSLHVRQVIHRNTDQMKATFSCWVWVNMFAGCCSTVLKKNQTVRYPREERVSVSTQILAGEREERIRNVLESQWMCVRVDVCVRVEFSSSENPFFAGIFNYFFFGWQSSTSEVSPLRQPLFHVLSVHPSFRPSTGSFIYYSCCSFFFFLFASQSRLPSSPSRSFFFSFP